MSNFLIKRFEKRFLRALQVNASASTVEETRRAFGEIFAANQHFVVDDPSHHNIVMTSWVLAAYKTLRNSFDESKAKEIVRYAFIEPDRKLFQFFTRVSLWLSRDALKTMAKVSKDKEVRAYGKTFSFERERDDNTAYFLNVNKCLYHDFFVKNGAPELTAVFCDFDTNWAEVIDPKRHGLKFERPGTLGYGQKKCQFQFSKVQRH